MVKLIFLSLFLITKKEKRIISVHCAKILLFRSVVVLLSVRRETGEARDVTK